MLMRAMFRLLPLLALLVVTPALAEGPHRLALQITDNDPDKMNAVLNVASNVAKYYEVLFRQGRRHRNTGRANADRVPSGIITLMELSEKGWTIVRP
jgi:hypothetical protein